MLVYVYYDAYLFIFIDWNMFILSHVINCFSLSAQQSFVSLEDVLKTSWRHVLKTPSTRLQHNNFTSSNTSCRRLEDILKTSGKTKIFYAEDVLKTSWRHVLKTSRRHVLKMSWRLSYRRLEDIVETSKILTVDIFI